MDKKIEGEYIKEIPEEEEEKGGLMNQMADIIRQKRDNFFNKARKTI
jgi:hypothetical protein